MVVKCLFLLTWLLSLCFAQLDPNWMVIWEDDFNGTEVDQTKWNILNQAGTCCGAAFTFYLPNQVSVQDGNLVIVADNTVEIDNMNWVSGMVNTNGKFSATFGRWEVRAKLPKGQGMWPAHWMTSAEFCWPVGSEIDIMENLGQDMNKIYGSFHYSKVCYQGDGIGAAYTSSYDLSADYHIYAVEWFPENITWWLDDNMYSIVTNNNLTDGIVMDPSPHNFILNTAVGGSWGGYPDNTTVFPQYHYIDYVRVYGWNPCSTGCSNHGCCQKTAQGGYCVCDGGYSGTFCEYNNSLSWEEDFTVPSGSPTTGWGNGYTYFRSDHEVISNGLLTLTLDTDGCPTNCSGMNYVSSGWTSSSGFSYGVYTYVAKIPQQSGLAATLGTAGNNGKMDCVNIQFWGEKPNTFFINTWQNGEQWDYPPVELPFDTSADFHTYSFEFYPSYITLWADGKLYQNASVGGIPTSQQPFSILLQAQDSWYGPFTYTQPIVMQVKSATWNAFTSKAECS